MIRPVFNVIQSGKEFKKWYWLKEELVTYCKLVGVSYVGSKADLLERIATVLDSEVGKPMSSTKLSKRRSTTTWSRQALTLETIISEDYTNGPNTRKFFRQYCGEQFRFTIPFMSWMKDNVGKTLQEAIAEWKRLHQLSKSKDYQSVIPESNQYNQYIRDFMTDNPTKTLPDARHFWQLKRSFPLEKHVYSSLDLDLREG